MARYLHLVRADVGPLAGSVIARSEPGAQITVVVLDGSAPPPLPESARLFRLGPGGLDYPALLDLIFESDHVISW
jgi:hypothetical protein